MKKLVILLVLLAAAGTAAWLIYRKTPSGPEDKAVLYGNVDLRQVDLAFLSATCREEFNLTELFREPLLCIVPQDWPEPQDGVMTPALMNGQSFVVQCDATDAEMRQFLKKYKIGTERRCHVIDDQSNIAMVEAGLGISIMPRLLLSQCTANIKIYPIDPEEDRVVGLAVQRPTAMAPAVEQAVMSPANTLVSLPII